MLATIPGRRAGVEPQLSPALPSTRRARARRDAHVDPQPWLDALDSTAGSWWTASHAWWTRAAGAAEAVARERLIALARFARAHSPLYRELYRHLPRSIDDVEALPVVDKHALMPRFEDWVTDRAIRRADVDAFLADRRRVGEPFLGRYVLWKSSGTTGEPGIFVQDASALSVYDALLAMQMASPPLAAPCAQALLAGGRAALVAATGDHFASIASWQRACRSAAGLGARGFSIMAPLDELRRDLARFSPAFLASYPTMLAVLAVEREAGRLPIEPALVWSGGEFLGVRAQARLERAFGCPVANEYGASECMSIAFGCRAGWLHVNADWVVVEPVDANHRPVAPGTLSDTVLVTNLANRVQPVIRYDLGDAVIAKGSRCECGNPLPAIRVQGRHEDPVTMPDAHGRPVALIPLALTTVVEEAITLGRFQIVARGARELALRLEGSDRVSKAKAFARAAAALRAYLASQHVHDASIVLDPADPARERSGKLRQVVHEPTACSPHERAVPLAGRAERACN